MLRGAQIRLYVPPDENTKGGAEVGRSYFRPFQLLPSSVVSESIPRQLGLSLPYHAWKCKDVAHSSLITGVLGLNSHPSQIKFSGALEIHTPKQEKGNWKRRPASWNCKNRRVGGSWIGYPCFQMHEYPTELLQREDFHNPAVWESDQGLALHCLFSKSSQNLQNQEKRMWTESYFPLWNTSRLMPFTVFVAVPANHSRISLTHGRATMTQFFWLNLFASESAEYL